MAKRFQIVDIQSDDIYVNKEKQFCITLYGKNEENENLVCHVINYLPHFYLKIPEGWDTSDGENLLRRICKNNPKSMNSFRRGSESHKSQVVKGKDFYALQWDKEKNKVIEYNFLKACFTNLGDMKKIITEIKKFYNKDPKSKFTYNDKDLLWINLDRVGTEDKICDSNLYESSIHPTIRFIHERDINPTGWVQVLTTDKTNIEKVFPYAAQDREYFCDWKDVDSIEDIRTSNYRIASFDIECDSLTGDFPMAKKDYKKLAASIFDSLKIIKKRVGEIELRTEQKTLDYDSDDDIGENKEYLQDIILNLLKIAFDIEWPDPKNYYEYTDIYDFETEGNKIIHEDFMKIISTEIAEIKDIVKLIHEEKHKNKERDNVIENIKDIITRNAKFISIKENITQLIHKYDNHNISIISGLLDKWKNREGKLLNNIIEKFKKKYSSFSDIKDKDVKIKGDPIIQIGTVFYDYGLSKDSGKDPWYRNILVIGPNDNMKDEEICSKMDNLNIDVVPCKNEKDLLIKWSELIKEYDPDFITGYNIFGFDFKYIKDRVDIFLPCPENSSGTCRCDKWGHHETCPKSTFYNLGKIEEGETSHRNKICKDVKQQLNSSALGENTFYYFNMDGRILFDLQKEIEKGHNLDSYKLDNVASQFMRGKLKEINKKRIRVSTIGTLKPGDYISFSLHSNIGEESYKDGKKIKINGIKDDNIYLCERLDIDFEKYHKIEWCLNKDDISPQDIFDKHKYEGPNGRAEVAKYCIQDCELCINLILLLDIIPNNLAMANVSYVPASYIFLRGQGVRITSVVSKKSSKRNTRIPDLIKIPNLNSYVKMAKKMDHEEEIKILDDYEKLKKEHTEELKRENKDINKINDLIEKDNDNEEITDIHRKIIRRHIVKDSDWRQPTSWELDHQLKQIMKKDKYKMKGYEGAIVLEPTPGIYLDDPVAVLDYASLYPSSIIEKNISHETFIEDESIIEENGWIENRDYQTITYDNWIYKGKGEGDTIEKLLDEEKPKIVCQFLTKDFMIRNDMIDEGDSAMGIIPAVLSDLLGARKSTKKRMNQETDDFKKKVLDGLQLAYKVTANSVYGQLGAKTSPIFKLELAACTTSVGRERLTVDATNGVEIWAKENGYEKPEVVYGDTDSVFVKFSRKDKNGKLLEGKEALEHSIKCGQEAGEFIKELMDGEGKQPQVLEYEKTFWPFILISKKRYTGDKYEFEATGAKRTAMGIVLKRRDNAPIVKYVFGHVIEKIMIDKDFDATVQWLKETLVKIRNGEFPLSYFVISKSLRGYYKNPQGIAHKVLADRMAERDPGNKPKANDRIPYVYMVVDDKPDIIGYRMKKEKIPDGFYKNGNPKFKSVTIQDKTQPKYKKKIILQGDRIEHVDYIKKNNVPVDYEFYITNQIMNPVKQVLDLRLDPKETEKLFLK